MIKNSLSDEKFEEETDAEEVVRSRISLLSRASRFRIVFDSWFFSFNFFKLIKLLIFKIFLKFHIIVIQSNLYWSYDDAPIFIVDLVLVHRGVIFTYKYNLLIFL